MARKYILRITPSNILKLQNYDKDVRKMAIIPLLTDKIPFTISFKVFPQKKGTLLG